jgi:hypothetical protein
VPGDDRDADADAGDPQVGQGEDLAGLVAELLLLIGLVEAVLDQRSGVGKDVVGDRLDVLVRLRERDGGPVVGELTGLVPGSGDLADQLLDAGDAGTRDRLVGRYDEPLETGLVVEPR